jgi:hypothetical protein
VFYHWGFAWPLNLSYPQKDTVQTEHRRFFHDQDILQFRFFRSSAISELVDGAGTGILLDGPSSVEAVLIRLDTRAHG